MDIHILNLLQEGAITLDDLEDYDDIFAFIAGYTSSGVAYGITWEEMESIEGEEGNGSKDEEIDLPFV